MPWRRLTLKEHIVFRLIGLYIFLFPRSGADLLAEIHVRTAAKMKDAPPRFTFCGDREPHPQHEYLDGDLDGARRMECPGVRDTSALADVAQALANERSLTVAECDELLRKIGR